MMISQHSFVLLKAEYITTLFSVAAEKHFKDVNDSGCALILCDCCNDVFANLSGCFSHNHNFLTSQLMTVRVFSHLTLAPLQTWSVFLDVCSVLTP